MWPRPSVCPLETGGGAAGVGDGFKRDTWAKHLFQMASHISAARGIIDLTCWPVHLRQPADERKTRGRLEEFAWETEEWHGERERTHKWICPSPCTGATLYNNSQCGLQWKHLLSTASFTALSQSNRCCTHPKTYAAAAAAAAAPVCVFSCVSLLICVYTVMFTHSSAGFMGTRVCAPS